MLDLLTSRLLACVRCREPSETSESWVAIWNQHRRRGQQQLILHAAGARLVSVMADSRSASFDYGERININQSEVD